MQGRSVEEVRAACNLSAKTVANYQTLIRQKLGASNTIELLRVAQRYGLAPV